METFSPLWNTERGLIQSSQFPFSRVRTLNLTLRDKELGQGHITSKLQKWASNLKWLLWPLPRLPFRGDDSS